MIPPVTHIQIPAQSLLFVIHTEIGAEIGKVRAEVIGAGRAGR